MGDLLGGKRVPPAIAALAMSQVIQVIALNGHFHSLAAQVFQQGNHLLDSVVLISIPKDDNLIHFFRL